MATTTDGVAYRLGAVLWWFGFAALAVLAVFGGAYACLPGPSAEGGLLIGSALVALGAVFLTLPAWAAAFVLAGNFLRPPSGPLSQRASMLLCRALLALFWIGLLVSAGQSGGAAGVGEATVYGLFFSGAWMLAFKWISARVLTLGR